MARRTYEVEEILSRSVDMTEDCWNWKKVVVRGYGQITYKKRAQRAHRLIYELLVGDIPKGLQLDHLCRNQLCVNPAHLEPVTRKENILRGISPAAMNARKAYCLRGHKLVGDNLYIRKDRPGRYCRACMQIRLRKSASQGGIVS